MYLLLTWFFYRRLFFSGSSGELKCILKVQLTVSLVIKPMFHLIQMRQGAGGQLRRGPYISFLLFSKEKKKKNTPKPTTQARLNVKMYRAVAFQFGPGPN